jgi:CheY-like chemotaxis protein
LSQDKLAQLFQPFNRLGQEGGTVEGTGIGLVVSKQLIELMGGTIGVESTVGVGSVFWIEMSRTQAPAPGENAVRSSDAQAGRTLPEGPSYTVLYVEDNPTNMLLVEELFARRTDLRLLKAVDATHGIMLARAERPDVVLMDINLPGMSGFQALHILAGDPATAHIPLVAVSANAMPQDIERALAAGFFRYVTKPIKVREFMETLDVALRFSRMQAGTAVPSSA